MLDLVDRQELPSLHVHYVSHRDNKIFKAILEPLIVDTVTEGFKKQRLDGDDAVDDVEVEELPDLVITPLNRYCK
jgi:hypothetical protein